MLLQSQKCILEHFSNISNQKKQTKKTITLIGSKFLIEMKQKNNFKILINEVVDIKIQKKIN